MAAPSIRFESHRSDPEWTSCSLAEIATFSKGKGISKSDLRKDGKTECVLYGELYTTYGQIIDRVGSSTDLNPKGLAFSLANDVIIPASGETQIDIATAACVTKSGVALGGDLNVIRSTANGKFLAYYLSGKKRQEIAVMAQGNSVVHLYPAQLKALQVWLPVITEQSKIASFLTAVDERIKQLEECVSLLAKYKKSAARKIFEQAVRFADEDGNKFSEWDLVELRDVASKVKTKNKDGAVSSVLTNSASRGIIDQGDYFEREIVNENNLDGYYVVDVGDFVYNPRISSMAPVGPIKRNKGRRGVMSPLYTVFRFNRGELSFFEQYFETSGWYDYLKSVANSGARHDRMNISNDDLFGMPLPFPSEKEQKKIAGFLSAIDDKIAGAENRIKAAKTYKAGLLQRMFV